MNHFSTKFPAIFILFLASLAGAQTADLSRLVVVGDSLSAGVQNISLIGTQQVNGYAPLIAQQAGVPLVLPLIHYPGLPNVLQLDGFNPLPIIKPAPGVIPNQARLDPNIQPTNLAQPGVPVAGALAPPSALGPVVGPWALAVLQSSHYPHAVTDPNLATIQGSQVAEAMSLNPTTVILWLGNNDALVPAITGAIPTLTPVPNFTGAFNKVFGLLASTHATMIVANIPDVTEIAFFTPITRIARLTFQSPATIAKALGTGPGDYLRMSALQPALDILIGKTKGPLPASCPLPYAGFPPIVTQVPCVLTASDAAIVRDRVSAYNIAIAAAVSNTPNATLVDTHALVDNISMNGYQLPGRNLNTSLLGGIFTLDGIHPTNTSYAIIANLFIQTMNAKLNTNIPAIDVKPIAKKDPLVFSLGSLLHMF